MKKSVQNLFVAILAFVACAMPAFAQIVTTSPKILQESSEEVVLTYHADSPLGNNGLKGVTADVYAHIGVITNKSTSGSDWKYAPQWKDNSAKYKLDFVEANTWNLTIGKIREYFGITDPNETVKQIAVVFRNANATKEGKTKTGGDIYVDVMPEGFQLIFGSDAQTNVLSGPATINFYAYTTSPSTISIAVNGKEVAAQSNATELKASYAFTDFGNYVVTATAKDGDNEKSQAIDISYPASSAAADYPGGVPQMGAKRAADGSVTFCIAAPGKKSAVIVPSWDDYKVLSSNTMNYQDYQGNRYFWITVGPLPTDQYLPYYFLVDGLKVGDPYAELVLDCYSDKWLDSSIWPDMPKYPYDVMDDAVLAVYCGDLHAYDWCDFEIPAHDNLIIYEMLFRDFTGTEGKNDANGTVRAAIDKLPYIKSLGVNAVELMPIMEFNGNNSWGYNTNFYFAPDKAYGSPLDYKEFIDECHRMGIAVILDIVFNQSDGLHPWYKMYSIDTNPFYNKKAPHDYSVLNDWKQDNDLVQQQWADVLKYWLTEYNVDGFRFDLVKGLGNNDSYGKGTEAYNQSRIDNMLRLQNVITSVKPDGIHINEHLAGAQEENAMAATGQLNWSNVNHAACQYAMGFADGISDLKGFYAPNWGRTKGSTVAYMESHDEERMAYKQNKYASEASIKNSHAVKMNRLGQLAVQMLIAPGSKMIWQFGELGADQTTKNSSGNDTSPKTVIWSYLDDADRAALKDTYAAMCELRTLNPDLFCAEATYNTTSLSAFNTRTFRIANGDKEVVVFVNAKTNGSTPEEVSVNANKLSLSNSRLVCASTGYDSQLSSNGSSVSVSLRPHEYAVYSTIDVAGLEGIEADLGGSNVKVYASDGQIHIIGDYRSASVYNAAGQHLGANLKMQKGLYIVMVDGQPHKVMVR